MQEVDIITTYIQAGYSGVEIRVLQHISLVYIYHVFRTIEEHFPNICGPIEANENVPICGKGIQTFILTGFLITSLISFIQ